MGFPTSILFKKNLKVFTNLVVYFNSNMFILCESFYPPTPCVCATLHLKCLFYI
jgi:hypothetical protein